MARLGDYVKIRTGKLDANASSEDGAYPFFTCSREPLRIDTYSYDCECVLVAGNGDLNVKYYSGKFDAYQRTYIIEVIDPNVLLPKYLFHFLDSYVDILRKQSIGGVIKYIKLGNLTEAIIPLPSVEQQAHIVKILEQCNSVIAIAEMQLSKLDELVKSRFIELFGDTKTNSLCWDTLPLHKVLEKGSSVSYGIVQTGDDVPNGVPVFRPVDIVGERRPRRVDLKCTTKKISDQYSRTLLRGYELLITVRGSVGDTFQVTNEFKDCNVGRNIVPLRFDTTKVTYSFMQCFFAQNGTKEVLKSLTKGIALQGLNMSEFREVDIILPPIELQNEFAAFVEHTDKLKLEVKNSLEKLETLKKSLMQEYFG